MVFFPIRGLEFGIIQACEKTCYQRNVIEQCRCSDAYFPPSNLSAFNHVIVPICSASNLTQGTSQLLPAGLVMLEGSPEK